MVNSFLHASILILGLQITSTLGQQQITACPTTESTTNTQNGLRYRTCVNSDYQGPSAQVVANVASMAACLNLCIAALSCDKAVYDNIDRYCHLKGGDTASLVWTTSNRFSSARRVDVGNVGKWGPLIQFPLIPVAAYVVPTIPDSNRLLMYSAYQTDYFGGANGYTQFADFNYKTGAISRRTVSNTQHDMFCPGMSSLPDGRVVVTGGANAEVTSIYNPATNEFTRGPNMQIARGYQTSVTLSNGKIFTIGGSFSGGIGGKIGEIYDAAANTWTTLPNAPVVPMLTTDNEGAWRTDNHGWLFAWRNGSVFQAGPSKTMHWYGTSGTGSVQAAGTRDPDNDAMCGLHVMYDAGKIFSAGGSQDYTNSDAFRKAHLITIGNPGQAATVERVPDMRYQRGFSNVVVLPDGKILVTGGQRRTMVFTNTDASLAAELFDPATKTWRTLAEELKPRNYHAVSILLGDGTVLSAGGGLCYDGGPCRDGSTDHPNGQIFSPPYLFNSDGSAATRPVISSVSATRLRAGATITVTMSNTAATKFSLIRMGSVTHSVNSDQRRIALTGVTQSSNRHAILLPADYGVLIPGYYYLFAVSSAGVPSVATVVQVLL
jgi:galactose oxidase